MQRKLADTYLISQNSIARGLTLGTQTVWVHIPALPLDLGKIVKPHCDLISLLGMIGIRTVSFSQGCREH